MLAPLALGDGCARANGSRRDCRTGAQGGSPGVWQRRLDQGGDKGHVGLGMVGTILAGLALRSAYAHQAARLRARGAADAGAGDRGQHGDLLGRQRRAAAATALRPA